MKGLTVDHQIQLSAREDAWEEERRGFIQQIHTLKQSCNQSQTDNLQKTDSVSNPVEELVERLAILSDVHEKLEQESRTKEKHLNSLMAQYAEMEAKFQTAETTAKQMEAKLQTAEATTQQMEAKLHSAEATTQQMEAKLQTAEATTQQMEAKLQKSEAERLDLETVCTDLEVKCQMFETMCQNLEAKCQTMEVKCHESEARRQDRERECQRWEEKLKIAYENRDREASVREAEKADLTRQLEEAARKCKRYECEAAATAAAAAAGEDSREAVDSSLEELLAENKVLKVGRSHIDYSSLDAAP